MTVPGINLSQSIQEKQARAQVRFFDRGLFMSIGVLLLLAALAGGIEWYVRSLESKMAETEMVISQKTAALKGKEVDRLVDFADRMQVIENYIQTEPNPIDILGIVEKNTLASLRLTELKFNRVDHTLRMTGVARTLKEVAQQMLVLKRLDTIEQVSTDGIAYNQEGLIVFSLILKQSSTETVTKR